jgi:hypothetical protein
MNKRKHDFQISLFGLPKCHFEFSQDDIERMRGFKRIFEQLINTDFIKKRMNETSVVFAGNMEKVIPEALWTDFNQKFRHFILQNDRYNYQRVKKIAFKYPSGGPTDVILRMDRMIDHQKKIAQDAYENNGMFNFRTVSGEIISPFEMWEKYVYTYNFHVNFSADNVNLETLDDFAMNPSNPNARAHLAECLIIKMAAFELTYEHICDILYFIDNPAADEAKYSHKSRSYPTDSYLKDGPIETRPICNKNGICLLRENSVSSFESIGPTSLNVIAKGTEIKEWRYVRGFHVLSDVISELTSAEAYIKIHTADGVAAAKRLLQGARAMIVRADDFVFQADLLEEPREWKDGELHLGLNGATAKIGSSSCSTDA